jgi:hypothetical protein
MGCVREAVCMCVCVYACETMLIVKRELNDLTGLTDAEFCRISLSLSLSLSVICIHVYMYVLLC